MINDKIAELFMNLFPDLYYWVVKPFLELKTFKTLIYGKDDEEFLAFGIFTLDEMQKIYQPGMNAFVALSVTCILIGIVLAGMKITSVGLNPGNRAYIIEFVKDLVIVGIVFFNLSTIYTAIFGVNYIFVELFSVSHEQALIEVKESVEAQTDVLGQIIINLCLLGLSIWANFYYMMRKLTIMMFLIMGPLMIALYLIPKTKGITIGWLKELIGTVMVQSIHAALYWIVALMTVTHTGLEGVILYIIFIPVAESIRGLLGLGGQTQNALSRTGAMFGMSAIAGMYGAVKGAMSDKSVAGALQNAYKGVKDAKGGSGSDDGETPDKSIGSNLGTDTGSTNLGEKMLKAGEITSKMGKATFGMAGAVAGSVMGPGGSMALSSAGFIAGGVVGGVTGRAGAVGATLGAKALQKSLNGFKEGGKDFKDTLNAESLADEKLAETLASDKTSEWENTNKDKFMKDMKQKFPDAHEDSLNNMWNKEVGSQKQRFLDEARDKVANIRKNDGSFAKADSLPNAAAEGLANNWAKENKEQFNRDYDSKYPIKSDMTDEEIVNRNSAKAKDWEITVSDKKREYAELANETAKEMSNGLDSSLAYINKDDFAKKVADKALLADKESFVKEYKAKNGDMTDEQVAAQFDKYHGDMRGKYSDIAKGASDTTSSVNAQELSTRTAENLSSQWEKDNKEKFTDAYLKQHPNADNQTVEAAWNDRLNKKRNSFEKLTDKVAQSLVNDVDLKSASINEEAFAEELGEQLYSDERAQYVADNKGTLRQQEYELMAQKAVKPIKANNAQELASKTADNLTQEWSDSLSNYSQFSKDFKKQNPEATQGDVKLAFKEATENKRNEFFEIAKNVAGSMTNGKDLLLTDINSNEFAQKLGTQLHSKAISVQGNNKNEDILDSTDFSEHMAKIDFDHQNRHRRQDFSNMANKAVNPSNKANAQQLTSQVADNFTTDWAGANQQQFTTDFKVNNPNATRREVEVAWNNAVDEKRKEFVNVASNVAHSMTNGKALSQSSINKDTFADNVATDIYNNEKSQYIAKHKSNNMDTQQIEVEFNRQHGGQRAYLQQAQGAIRNIQPGKLYSRDSVNTDYLATQLAHLQTDNQKSEFIKQQVSNNVSSELAHQMWEQQQPDQYQKNLSKFANAIPKHIPLDKTIHSNKTVQGAAAIGNFALTSFVSGTGIKDIGHFVSDTKIGKVAIAGASGTVLGMKQGLNSNGSLLTKGVNIVKDSATRGFQEIATSIQAEHVPENPIERQASFKNAIAYTAGIVGGVNGYKKGARVGMKLNPYNNSVQNKISEVSDIAHLAQKVDDGQGNMVIAKGAVQLVTDNNKSYIQVKDRTGQTKVVSRLGSGDSSMKKGEVVYQDLTIQDGSLLQDSNPYKYDSGGAKVQTNRPLNINPTKLLVNNNTPKTPRVVQEIQAFNQKVDSGQYHTEEVIKDTQNKKIKMVIQRDRSYMVSVDESGEAHRISPYGLGDARLDQEQEREITCSIRNRRIVKDSSVDDDFTTSLEPTDLIPIKQNKRLQQRKEFEKIRYKKVGGTS
ncbi:hypothetical protein CJ195_15545 [Bacillus sp. UMB0899]|nr:hypothetical protein CJ195_15545 [Bacillus sp. UMB0899]